ncbi:MAG: PA0069 family radical SAM protein [Verrucomicrobiota bacterium]
MNPIPDSHASYFPPRGRGVTPNPTGRFEALHLEVSGEEAEDFRQTLLPEFEEEGSREETSSTSCQTTVLVDDSQTIISKNESPDIRFDRSINPYRGCEHGCSYCYARPYHEYLGWSPGLDFETKILAKPQAADLLEKELTSPSWEPQPLACSGVTDCYQPLERQHEITRACLEVLTRLRHPVAFITKNQLITRDIDLLSELAHYRGVTCVLSLTTLDPALARNMEPRASTPAARLRTIRALSEAGIPVGISIAPIIPGLNDHEIPALLEAAKEHGASFSAHSVLRLPYRLPELFMDWVDRLYPERRDRLEARIRAVHGGKWTESSFGDRMSGTGPEADSIHRLFRISAQKVGLLPSSPTLSSEAFLGGREKQLCFDL